MIQKAGLVLISSLLLTGCYSLSHKKCRCKKKDLSAYTEIKSVSDSSVQGWVQFDWAGRKQVKVTAQVTGLKPNEKVGFHIHEFGDCGNQALNAGGHFNPRGHKHGGPADKKRHCGDLGNLEADAEGKAVYEKVVHGKVYKLLGRSVIVHSQADDLKTQPIGNSGTRVACGVVGAIAKPAPVPVASEVQPSTEGTANVVEITPKADQPAKPKVVPAAAKPTVTPKAPAVKKPTAVKAKKAPVVPVAVTKPSGAAAKKEGIKKMTPKVTPPVPSPAGDGK